MNLSKNYDNKLYGWLVVGACFIIGAYSHGVVSFSFTALFGPIVKEFGWSYSQVSVGASLRGLEVGLLAPIVGMLVDRWGSRKLLSGGAIIIGIGFVTLSRINSLSYFYAAFALISIGSSCLGSTVLMAAVVSWFRREEVAKPLGITGTGLAAGGLLVPLVVALIDTLGWRTAILISAVGMWLIIIPLSILVRRKPRQHRHMQHSELENVVDGYMLPSAKTVKSNIQTKRVIMSIGFWQIGLGLCYQTLVVSAVVTHVMPYLSSLGISRSISSLIASAAPVASICGRLMFGWLGDRLNKKLLIAVSLAMLSLGLLFFGAVGTGGIWLLVPFLIFFGIGWGGSATLRPALVREYFGGRKFATIHGFVVGVMMFGHLAGAPLAGWTFDKYGSYQGIWFVLAAMAILFILSITTCKLRQNGL